MACSPCWRLRLQNMEALGRKLRLEWSLPSTAKEQTPRLFGHTSSVEYGDHPASSRAPNERRAISQNPLAAGRRAETCERHGDNCFNSAKISPQLFTTPLRVTDRLLFSVIGSRDDESLMTDWSRCLSDLAPSWLDGSWGKSREPMPGTEPSAWASAEYWEYLTIIFRYCPQGAVQWKEEEEEEEEEDSAPAGAS